ncbi:hypothetical protein [Streptacidiphilus sp. MAP5-3]|uniref:hypothetical protein n=1 Tax=unclassified Streptacidiphilus TaxID=2643834 RepID=UPI00351184BC
MGPFGPYGRYGGPHHGGLWIFPVITMVIFWVLLLIIIVLLVRFMARRSRWNAQQAHQSGPGTAPGPGGWPGPPKWGPRAQAAPSAEQLLAERLARGDIEVDDYYRRLAALRGEPPQTEPPIPPIPPEPPATT